VTTQPKYHDGVRLPRPVSVVLYPTRTVVRRLAWASLASQIGIVVTGGAVRLTSSGLGCPAFPGCTDDSLVTTPELGIHGFVEFGNRLLTFVLSAIAVLTLVAVHRLQPARRSLRVLGWILMLGIPAQALIGGWTVLTDLNPWIVMLHFMCSAVLIAVATTLVRRVDEPVGAVRAASSLWVTRLAMVVWVLAFATLYVGTVVTGSGPHAGDPDSPRTGLDVGAMAQLHADLVFLLIGTTIGLYVAARAAGAPPRTVRAAGVLLGVEFAQAGIGFAQYFTGLPVLLVGFHMLGAALIAAAATDAVLATRVRAEVPVPMQAVPQQPATTPPHVS
jgi:heme a synthase